MEFKKRAKFVTDFYGGKGYLSGDKIVKKWLESQQDRLLAPRYRELKDAIGNEGKLEDILSVFNTNDKGHPVIGDWMLFRCSVNAQKMAGTWNKFKVSADQWRDFARFTPPLLSLSNGKVINKPNSVEVYTVTTKVGGSVRSFFKAYQIIKAGAEFEFVLTVPDDLCEKATGTGKDKIFEPDLDKTKECIDAILEKMQIIGIGAFRERFGKFKYV